jgi:hypothetical protein
MKRKRRHEVVTVWAIRLSLRRTSLFTHFFFSHSEVKLCAVLLLLRASVSQKTDTDRDRKRNRCDTKDL